MQNEILLRAYEKGIDFHEYLETMSERFVNRFKRRYEETQIPNEYVERLKKLLTNKMIIAFSAQWCGDCSNNVPVLAKISEHTGAPLKILGGIKSDPKGKGPYWKSPPSPQEINELRIKRIPWIAVIDDKGNVHAIIDENPKYKPTVYEELVYLMTRGDEVN